MKLLARTDGLSQARPWTSRWEMGPLGTPGSWTCQDACPICGALRYKIRREDPGKLRGAPFQEESSYQGHVVLSYNTMFEVSV
jgi:hypothetical protein